MIYLAYLNNYPKPSSSFFMSPILPSDIRTAICSLNNSCCVDFYGLNSRILRASVNFIVEPLTMLVNHCIEEDNWSDSLKITKITSIFKKGELNNVDN